MNSTAIRVRKISLLLLIAIFIIAVIWYLFIANTFTNIHLANGADKFNVVSTYSGITVAKGTKNGIFHIPRGQYFIRSYARNTVAGIVIWHTPMMPFSSLASSTPATNTQRSIPVIGDFADFATPLTDGSYIYLNTRSKAVDIATSAGIKDVSNQFNLSTGKLNIYNQVVSIYLTNTGSAVVVTTKGVYLVTSATRWSLLNSYQPNFSPNYYSAAYDSTTNSVLLLNAYDKNVYAFNLSQPFQGLYALYTANKQPQAITAGGGNAILYGDNFPSIASNVLKQYSLKTIITPIQINIATKKLTATFTSLKSPVLIVPSPQGTYLAVKQKYSTLIDVYDINTSQSIQLPAYDLSGIAWLGNTLYIGRDNAVWSYQAGSDNTILKKIADTGAGITSITAGNNNLTITTLNNSVQVISLNEIKQTSTYTDVQKLLLTSKGYNVIFSNIDHNLFIDTETSRQLGDQLDKINPIENTLQAAFPESTKTITTGQNIYTGVYKYATINLTL